jgi:hypothetical protein
MSVIRYIPYIYRILKPDIYLTEKQEIPMPYAERDSNGKIIALHNNPGQKSSEKVSVDNAEVISFLLEGTGSDKSMDFLSITDSELVRVVEDLVDLLIKKNIILFTELPKAAQNKLMSRREARSRLTSSDVVTISEEDDLI